MQTQLLKELNNVLKTFPQYWHNQVLKRYEVIDAIENKEPSLIKALVANEKLKKQYGSDIDGILLFDFSNLVSLIQYKEYWQDSFTKYKNKIGLTIEGGNYLDYNSDVVLDFPFKDCMLEGGMTKSETSKKEIYYNEVIAADEIDRLKQPKILTNAKRYSIEREEEYVTKIKDTESLVIKGNNLLALHTLKQNSSEKIDLIYIDPPYNTDNDSFRYNDRFTRSTWLVFMKNRLEIARRLLSESGFIVVQIDHNQAQYLKILMDEIFGEENFRNEIIWSYRTGGVPKKGMLPRKHDNIFVYAKSKNAIFVPFKERQYLESSFMGSLTDSEGRYYVDTTLRDVFEGVINVVDDDVIRTYNTRPVLNLSSENIDAFKSQKPEGLIHLLVDLLTKKGDTVLDFFAGTGTTCRVCMKTGRRFIAIEQMDSTVEDILLPSMNDTIHGKQSGISESVKWQGGGSFVYCELAKLNQNYVDKIAQAKTIEQLLSIFDTMKAQAYLNYQIELENILKTKYEIEGIDQEIEFSKLALHQQKELLIDLLDKNQLYINLSEIDDINMQVSDIDKQFTQSFYHKGV